MWISQADEDSKRTPNHQSPPPQWTQAPFCLKEPFLERKFPKQARLRTRFEFRKIQREGARFQGNFLFFQFITQNTAYSRLGLTVSKRFGSAVLRNLLKRRLREVFRKQKHTFPLGFCLHITPRPKIDIPTFMQIQSDFTLLFGHLEKEF